MNYAASDTSLSDARRPLVKSGSTHSMSGNDNGTVETSMSVENLETIALTDENGDVRVEVHGYESFRVDGSPDREGASLVLFRLRSKLRPWHLIVAIVVAFLITLAIVLPLVLSGKSGGGTASAAVDVAADTVAKTTAPPTTGATTQSARPVATETVRPTTARPTTPAVRCDGRCEITLPGNSSLFHVSAKEVKAACFAGDEVIVPVDGRFDVHVLTGHYDIPTSVRFDVDVGQTCPEATWHLERNPDTVTMLLPGKTHCKVQNGAEELCSVPWRWSCPNAAFGFYEEGREVWTNLKMNVQETVALGDASAWRFYREVADSISGGHLYVEISDDTLNEGHLTGIHGMTQMRTTIKARAMYERVNVQSKFRQFESTAEPRRGCMGDPMWR